MAGKKKIVDATCPICGNSFRPNRHGMKYGYSCRKYRKSDIHAYQMAMAAKKKMDSVFSNFLSEVDTYNKEHGTELSYGQYESILYQQTIKAKERVNNG